MSEKHPAISDTPWWAILLVIWFVVPMMVALAWFRGFCIWLLYSWFAVPLGLPVISLVNVVVDWVFYTLCWSFALVRTGSTPRMVNDWCPMCQVQEHLRESGGIAADSRSRLGHSSLPLNWAWESPMKVFKYVLPTAPDLEVDGPHRTA